MKSAKTLILENERYEGESVNGWCKRLSLIEGHSWYSIKVRYYKLLKDGIIENDGLVLKKVVTHANGTKTTVHGQNSEIVDTSGMAIERVTTSPNGGQWIKYKNEGLSEDGIEEVLSKMMSKHPSKVTIIDKPKTVSKASLNVIITDDHIGLDTNPEGIGLFPYVYDEKAYAKSMEKVFRSILKEYNSYGTFEEIVINNLGDLEDGWDGQTTRGGHDLPQVMTNDEVFEMAVDSRLDLIGKIVSHKVAKKIKLRVVTNSNHSASFAVIVAKSIKKICALIYDEDLVEIDILRKFIEHRGYGDHCFLLSHGKDKKEMKAGLPDKLNDKAVIYLNSYIDFHNLRDKYKYFHVWKGDRHVLNVSDHKNFDYTSFRALCPPSNWAGTNFGDVTNPGYSIIVVPKNKEEISESHIKLHYKKAI